MVFSNQYFTLADNGRLIELLKLCQSNTTVEARYWEIYCLLYMGKTSEAREKLLLYESKFSSDFWRAAYFFLQGFDHWGHGTDESLEYYEKSFGIAKRLDNKLLIAQYYIFCGIILRNRNDPKGNEFFELGYKLSQELNFKTGIFWYHHSLASRGAGLADPVMLLEHNQINEEMLRKSGNEFFLTFALNMYGNYYRLKKQYDVALEYFKEALSLSEKTESGWSLANSLAKIAEIYNIKGLLHKELKYLEILLDTELHLNHRGRIAYCLISMADIFMEKGDLDRALQNYESALKIHKFEKVKSAYSYSLISIGNIYKLKGDFSKALQYFEEGFSIRLQLNDNLKLIMPYTNIINVLSAIDRKKAKVYLDKFGIVEKTDQREDVIQNYKFCKAIYLKESTRLRDKFQAQLLLEELIRDNKDKESNIMEYILHLIELLLLEYSTSKEQIVIEELHQHLAHYTTLAQTQKRFPAVIRSLIIQAKLASIEGDYSKSRTFLDRGFEIASTIDIPLLIEQLQSVKSKIESELTRMEEVVHKNIDITAKLNESRIISYVKEVQQFVEKDFTDDNVRL